MLSLPARCDAHLAVSGGEDGGGEKGQMWAPVVTDLCAGGVHVWVFVVSCRCGYLGSGVFSHERCWVGTRSFSLLC